MTLACPTCGRETPGLLACGECAAPRRPAEIEALDHFALFGLPRGHAVARAALERAYVEAAKALHPDRMPGALRGAARRLQARVNDAYAVLKDPDRRARYLVALEGGGEVAASRAVPEAFLERQLALRERAETAAGEALRALRDEAAAEAGRARAALEAHLAGRRWGEAQQILNELQFLSTFVKQADERIQA